MLFRVVSLVFSHKPPFRISIQRLFSFLVGRALLFTFLLNLLISFESLLSSRKPVGSLPPSQSGCSFFSPRGFLTLSDASLGDLHLYTVDEATASKVCLSPSHETFLRLHYSALCLLRVIGGRSVHFSFLFCPHTRFDVLLALTEEEDLCPRQLGGRRLGFPNYPFCDSCPPPHAQLAKLWICSGDVLPGPPGVLFDSSFVFGVPPPLSLGVTRRTTGATFCVGREVCYVSPSDVFAACVVAIGREFHLRFFSLIWRLKFLRSSPFVGRLLLAGSPSQVFLRSPGTGPNMKFSRFPFFFYVAFARSFPFLARWGAFSPSCARLALGVCTHPSTSSHANGNGTFLSRSYPFFS